MFIEDGTEDEVVSSMHMRNAFSMVGIGCLIGPAVVNLIMDAHRPYTLLRACLIGVGFLTTSWLFISQAHSFPQFLAGTCWRTFGSGIVWVNSTLVLQTLTDKEILGRVLGLEYTLKQLFEESSAAASGKLDDAGFSKNGLALFGALVGTITMLFWGIYYSSLGAASPTFNNKYYEFENSNEQNNDNLEMGSGIEGLDIEMTDASTSRGDEEQKGCRSQRVFVRIEFKKQNIRLTIIANTAIPSKQ